MFGLRTCTRDEKLGQMGEEPVLVAGLEEGSEAREASPLFEGISTNVLAEDHPRARYTDGDIEFGSFF